MHQIAQSALGRSREWIDNDVHDRKRRTKYVLLIIRQTMISSSLWRLLFIDGYINPFKAY